MRHLLHSRGSWFLLLLLLLQAPVLAVPVRTGAVLVPWGTSRLPADLDGYTAVADSWFGAVAVRPDGRLDYWSVSPDNAAFLATLDGVADVVEGEGGILIRRADGRVVAIGDYATELEDYYHVPFPDNLTNVMAVAAVGKHALFLTAEGHVLACGEQYWGECDVPLSATNVIQIAASRGVSVALRADGTLVGWGAGHVGNLKFPPGLSNVVKVALDLQNTYALRADGRLWIFGANQPEGNEWRGASNVVDVAANKQGCFVLLGDGTLRTVVGSAVPDWLLNVTALYCQMDAGGAWVQGPLLSSSEGEWVHGRRLVPVGTNLTLRARVPGGEPVSSRWLRNDETLTGETGSSLSLSNLQPGQSGFYKVVCETPAGERTSPAVELVIGLPRITAEPESLDVEAGADVRVRVEAEAAAPLTYSWRVNGELIEAWNAGSQAFPQAQLPGNSPVVNLSPARVEMSGDYDVVVGTDYGSVTSRVATVRIRPAPVADVKQLEFGAWANLRDVISRYELAQTFTARISGRLERIYQGGNFSEPAREYPTIFSILDTKSNEPGTSVLGRVVVRSLSDSAVVSFHDQNVFLEANHRYTLLIQTDAARTLGATYSFPVSGWDAYADGELWVRSPPSTNWTRFINPVLATPADLAFITYCFPGIPELRVAEPRSGRLIEINKAVALEALTAPDFAPASEVTFRVNGSTVGSRSAPPWRLDWIPSTLGDAVIDVATTRANGDAAASSPVQVRVVGPKPPNDDFAARRVLTGENPLNDFTFVGATSEPGESPLAAGAAGHSVWWSWTAPRGGRVHMTFLTGDTNLLAGVLSGSSVDSALMLTNGDGGCEWTAEQGAVYQLVADSRGPTPEFARLAVALNDVELDSPANLAVFTSPARVLVAATRRARVRALTNVVLELDGTPVTHWLTEPYASELEILEPGRHELTVASTDTTGVTTHSKATQFIVRPVNDAMASAISLSGNHLRTECSNREATAQLCDPHYGDNQGGHSIWYRWTAPEDGVGMLRGEGLPQGVLLGAYSGSGCPPAEIIVNAFAASGQAVYFNAVAGNTYSIMVDGLFGEQGLITWTLDLLPRNDLFVWRSILTGTSHEEFFSMSPSPTLEAAEANLAPEGSIGSWWWSWTAPQAGRVRVRVGSPTGPVAMGAFVGDPLRRLQVIARSGGFAPSAEVEFSAEAGRTYAIAVFASEPAEGMARLELTTETLRLISPDSGTTIRLGDSVVLEARLEIPDEQLSEVRFLQNGVLLSSLTRPPFVLPWTPQLPGSYLIGTTARTSAGNEYASLPARLLVYEGENLPKPRLVSGPGFLGTFLLDATGTLHLFGVPVAALGNTATPGPGTAQLGLWPTNVTGWRAVAASGEGALSSLPDIGQSHPAPFPGIWALSDQGALYYNGTEKIPYPDGVTRFVSLSSGLGNTVAVGDDGGVYANGGPRLALPPAERWVDAGFGADYLAALAESGEAYVFNRGTFGNLLTTRLVRPMGVQRWASLRAAPWAFYLLDSRGEIYGVAAEGIGELSYDASLITRPDGVSRWHDLSVGSYHVVAIGDDGQLYAWGRNLEGQLGLGGQVAVASSPLRIPNPPGVTAWVAAAAGTAHTMALGNNCSLYAWGWNQNGELGLAPSLPIFQPTRVSVDAATCGQLVIFARVQAALGPDGSFELAFPTLLNRRYAVQYSDDLDLWKTAFPPVTGTGEVVKWIDSGPPVTDSLPVSESRRIYRILLAP